MTLEVFIVQNVYLKNNRLSGVCITKRKKNIMQKLFLHFEYYRSRAFIDKITTTYILSLQLLQRRKNHRHYAIGDAYPYARDKHIILASLLQCQQYKHIFKQFSIDFHY